MPTLTQLLDRLWEDYRNLNPQAREVRRLLEDRGETIVNDHIAFRTFDLSPIGLDALASPFVAFGYEPKENYDFPEKKLSARYYAHPDSGLPKIFISELRTRMFGQAFQNLLKGLVSTLPADISSRWDFSASGRPWSLPYSTYDILGRESEYAAWVSAFGFRPNHFTVSVNALKTFAGLRDLNDFLKQQGFSLNSADGEIKGTPEQLLEQSSTLANAVPVKFTDGVRSIPACYYEFARRYPRPDGTLFQGFIPASANRIFESTDRR